MKRTFTLSAALVCAAALSAAAGGMENLRSAAGARAALSARPPMATAPAKPGKIKVATVLTCGNDDADFWYETGISLSGAGGMKALLVAHNEDTGAAKLKMEVPVSVNQHGETTVYEEDGGALLLAVRPGKDGALTAELTLRREGGSSVKEAGIACRENSSISYDGR